LLCYCLLLHYLLSKRKCAGQCRGSNPWPPRLGRQSREFDTLDHWTNSTLLLITSDSFSKLIEIYVYFFSSTWVLVFSCMCILPDRHLLHYLFTAKQDNRSFIQVDMLCWPLDW
jgi:hypothetical protein